MSAPASLSGAAYSRTAVGRLLSEWVVALDQRYEPRACDRDDMDAGVERAHELRVAAARHRGLGGEKPDAAIPRGEHGRVRFRGEHTDHRNRELTLEIGKRGSSRRVARRDDQLDALILEIARDLARKAADLVEWARAVGKPRAVAEVHEVLVGKRDEALVQDGEAAHARVEDADRPWIHERGV